MPTSWTKDEEKQLIKELKENKSYEELTKIHNRSVSALMMRYNKIIYDNIEAGKSKSSLAKLMNTTIDKITQSYYEHKAFIDKKSIIDNSKDTEKKHLSENKEKKNTQYDKGNNLEKKIDLLQKQNQLMKQLIDNIKIKKELGKIVTDKDLYNLIIKFIKKSS